MSRAADEAQLPLARLFAIAYRQLITDLHAELARRGWTDVRPAYGFALLALREGPLSSGELGVLMGMTKQAASKLVEALVDAGYARRGESTGDARVRPIELTDRGRDLQDNRRGHLHRAGEAMGNSDRRRSPRRLARGPDQRHEHRGR